MTDVRSAEQIFSWVEALTRFSPRLPNTAGGRLSAEYLRDQFLCFGLDRVTIEETPTLAWVETRHRLQVGGLELPSQALMHSFTRGEPCSFSTPPSGLQADLVFVGLGAREDFDAVNVEGKIVLAEGRFQKMRVADQAFHVQGGGSREAPDDFILNVYSPDVFPANYYRAVAAGAVGFIGILSDYFRARESYANEAYDAYNGSPLPIPGLWVSPATGEVLRRALASADGSATASLVLEGSLSEATSRTVLGFLPGRGEDRDETIVVESHYDSATPGAVQDASGTSAVLALAEYFAQIPAEDRNRSLLFCAFDTHAGDYAAHHHFVETHIDADNVVFAAAIEHIGKDVVDGPEGPVVTDRSVPRILWVSPARALIDIAVDVVVAHDVERTTILSADFDPNELASDADYLYQAGLPVLSLVGVPTYLYDEIDTPDKVNQAQLRSTARAFADAIARIDRLPSGVLAEARRPPNETMAQRLWRSRT